MMAWTWGHMMWIFFPIPLFCLILLSVPLPSVIERYRERRGVDLIGGIFFTRVSVGPVRIRLVHVFIGMSFLIFGMASATIRRGFGSAHAPCSGGACPYHSGETMWYRKASRFRAERNFWLSLFTLVLWLLVYNIYSLKRQIVQLRGNLDAISSDGYKTKEGSSKKQK